MLDFDLLRKSRFFAAGRLCLPLQPNKDTLVQYPVPSEEEIKAGVYISPVCGYNVDMFDASILDRILDRDFLHHGRQVGVSLFGALDGAVPKEFRELIVNQWQEVVAVTARIPFRPHARNFVIQPPNTEHAKHPHYPGTVRTLVLVYKYSENKQTMERSYMNVGANDEARFEYSSDRCFMLFKNNPPHWSVSYDEWIFFWPTDYTDEFEIDNIPGFTPTVLTYDR